MPPCDYGLYHKEWKTKIRPDILERDGHCCKFCKVPNKAVICRGEWDDKPVWQNDDGQIYDATNGKYLGSSYVGNVWDAENLKKQILTKVVLTIAHLDQNKENNDYNNLAALCQRCHLRIDLSHHMKKSRETRRKKKGLQNLF